MRKPTQEQAVNAFGNLGKGAGPSAPSVDNPRGPGPTSSHLPKLFCHIHNMVGISGLLCANGPHRLVSQYHLGMVRYCSQH